METMMLAIRLPEAILKHLEFIKDKYLAIYRLKNPGKR